MKYLALLAFIFTAQANAQCFGPGGCQPTEPVGPAELCLPDGCAPVSYEWNDRFMLAFSYLPNGFPVMGWSGACDQPICPDIKNQAFTDLELNAKRANRAQRY